MIVLIVGENSYVAEQEIRQIRHEFGGDYSRIDGSAIDENQLADLMTGTTLFSQKRVIVIAGASENKTIWDKIGNWADRSSEDTVLIIVEPKPDRRTKTYKNLAKLAKVIRADYWSDRDTRQAQQWLVEHAKRLNVSLSSDQVRNIIDRATHQDLSGKLIIDQYQIHNALMALRGLDNLSDEAIDAVLPANIQENIFGVLETALQGRAEQAIGQIRNLSHTEDAYKFYGLLASQWSQLVGLAVANKPVTEVASDIGAHPFVLGKLAQYTSRFDLSQLRSQTRLLADLDEQMKNSSIDPWICVERFIISVANQK